MSERTAHGAMECLGASVTAAVLLLLLSPGVVGAEGPLRDPTRPPLQRVDPASDPKARPRAPLALTAVFFAEGHRIAIVNGERVGVGDVVQGARVIAIERGRVVLVREDTRFELELVDDVKRPTRGGTIGKTIPAAPGDPREETRETPRVPKTPREGSPS